MSSNPFSVAEVQSIIADTLVIVPPDHQHAFVGTAESTGAQVLATFLRTGNGRGWHLTGTIRHPWHGARLPEGAVVVHSW